jgi:hypothetical protein
MIAIAEMIRDKLPIPDRREVWEWAGGTPPNYDDAAIDFGRTTAFSGRYDIENVPWCREFLRACNDPRVRRISFVAPPQDSGKTKAAETYMCYRIKNRPAPMAYNIVTNVKAEQWHDTRWKPMLKSVAGMRDKLSDDRRDNKTRRIMFKDGTFLLIQGAETKANRAGDSVEVQINDELNLWELPWVKEMHERTNAYRDTRKIINVSVAGKKGGEWHLEFLSGNQLEWHHHCDECGKPFDYVFDHKNPRCNMHFDIQKAVMHEDGRLDLREFKKTIYVQCQNKACGHKMGYDRERLRRLNRNGVYIARNPDADPSNVSLHINSFAIGREPWDEILEPWVRMFIRGGVFAFKTLEEFITKKLAEFWDEKPFAVTTDIKLAGFTKAEILSKKYGDEIFRCMAIDNQRGRQGDLPHRIFAAGAFSRNGRIRVFDGGRVNEWNELRERQLSIGIPDPTEETPGPFTLCDRRYDPTTVDEWCAKFKWYGTLGAASDEFVHPPWSPFAGTRQLFSEMRMIDVGYGSAEGGRTFATYFLWSSQKLQDILAELRNSGMIEFARDSGDWAPDLGTQMNSHRQIMEPDKFGQEKRVWKKIGDTPDHIYDCVSQLVVVGLMAGIIKKE